MINFVLVDLFQLIISTLFVFDIKLWRNKKKLLIPHIIGILIFFSGFKKPHMVSLEHVFTYVKHSVH